MQLSLVVFFTVLAGARQLQMFKSAMARVSRRSENFLDFTSGGSFTLEPLEESALVVKNLFGTSIANKGDEEDICAILKDFKTALENCVKRV
jgi:hypothetical protein